MSLLSNTDFKLGNTTAVPKEVHTDGTNIVYIGEFESISRGKADYCPDFTGSATLRNFAFASVRI
jgi:hypothetical protein